MYFLDLIGTFAFAIGGAYKAKSYFLPNFLSKTYSIFRFFDSLGLAAFVIIGVSVPMNYLFLEIQSPTILSAVVCIFPGIFPPLFGDHLFTML